MVEGPVGGPQAGTSPRRAAGRGGVPKLVKSLMLRLLWGVAALVGPALLSFWIAGLAFTVRLEFPAGRSWIPRVVRVYQWPHVGKGIYGHFRLIFQFGQVYPDYYMGPPLGKWDIRLKTVRAPPTAVFVIGVLSDLWPGLALTALALAPLLPRAYRRRRNPGFGEASCPKCGYDLRAHNPGDRCPECGSAVPDKPAAKGS